MYNENLFHFSQLVHSVDNLEGEGDETRACQFQQTQQTVDTYAGVREEHGWVVVGDGDEGAACGNGGGYSYVRKR